MTKHLEWKMAKWLKHHGNTKRCDLPAWFDAEFYNSRFFSTEFSRYDSNGYPEPSPQDLYLMNDEHIDAFIQERRHRIHEFRDWIEPVGVIVATILSIIAIIVSIIALRLEFPELQTQLLEPEKTAEVIQSIHISRQT